MTPGFGNLTGYEEGPNGITLFKQRDGRSFAAIPGPATDAMKARLDAATAAAPKPTAGIIGPQALVTSSAQPAQPAVRADFAAPVPGAAPPTFNAKAEAANLVGAPPPAPPPPAPASIARPAGMPGTQAIAPGHRFNPETGLIEAYRGGSGGSKGGWRDTSQSVRGGFDPNAEYVQTVEGAMQRGSEAEQLGIQGDQSLADAEHSAAFKTALHYDDAVRQAADRADAIENRVRELDANYERLNKDYNGSKVNPGRLFAGGRNWVHGILAGLGTFGAGMAGRQSMTMQVLQQRIADDIDAQRAEIAVKRDAADNAYKRLLQETGSDDLARKALHGLQLERIRSEAEVMAKDGKDKKRQAMGQSLLAAADQRIAKFREDYRQASLGEVTKGMVYVPASPGRPAGWYPVSDQLGTATKVQSLQQGEAAIQKTAADIAKTQAEAAAGPQVKKSEAQLRYENILNSEHATLKEFVEARGGQLNEETGEITGTLNLPTDWPGPDSDDVASAKSDLTGLGMVHANMMNAGAEAGQPTKEAMTPDIGLTGNAEGPLRAMARENAIRRQQLRKQGGGQ